MAEKVLGHRVLLRMEEVDESERKSEGGIILATEHVIGSMIDGWEEPTLEEGFHEIWYAE